MKSVSVKSLLKKLSGVDLDSIEFFGSQGRDSFTEDIAGLCKALLQLKGEASSIAIAEEILRTYRNSDEEEKLNFFQYLNEELAANTDLVDQAISDYQHHRNQQQLQALARAAESPRQDLFRVLNTAPQGTNGLIGMRQDLLRLLADHPELKPVDFDLLHLFKSWFNRGFLELKRIDWETPAFVLEKLIEYESVHEIQGWPDLRRRLADDRRCFGFFHPVIPNEPLIFVEVALTREISTNIRTLLNEPVPEGNNRFRTAIFYSINNCFTGLRGVSFGNFLIKQVIENVAAEMPGIKHYATLSPVPGFTAWLRQNLASLDFLEDEQQDELQTFLQSPHKHEFLANREEALKDLLLQLCAYYLVKATHRGKPANPVARFHLGNGARLEQINWMADDSENGMEQAAGIMVNYLYDRKTLTRNHEAFVQNGEVACSGAVTKLLPGSRKS